MMSSQGYYTNNNNHIFKRSQMPKKIKEDSSKIRNKIPIKQEYIPSQEASVMLRQGSEFALHASPNCIPKKKKFITRMRQFNPQPHPILTHSYDQDSLPPPTEGVSARDRNNLAARISRKRKKMYIELLEEQNTNLEMELYSLNEEIQMLRTQIFNAIMHADQVSSNNAQIQSLVIKKLKALSQHSVPRSPQNDAQINICLDSCIYRIGSNGNQRRAILDILYKGFINRNLPNIYRFILWYSLHRFDRNGPENWWELMQSDLMKPSYDRFLDEQGDGIAFKGREIYRCAREILTKKKQIQTSGQLFDNLIKQLREILTPAQFAQLFLFTQRSTPKRELQLFQQTAAGQQIPDICQGSREQHSLASPSKKRRKLTEQACRWQSSPLP